MGSPAAERGTDTSAARGTSRLAQCFQRLAERRELGLVVYLTAGDPSLEATVSLVSAAVAAGADVVELGVPFSDPIADGPVIQRASDRALRAGVTLAAVLECAARLRAAVAAPLVLFSYFNPILQMGLERFATQAAGAGIDGVLVTDLPPEEADGYRRALASVGLSTIFLAAPTSSEERLARLAASSSGFLYLVSRTGVTGARKDLPEDLASLVARVRRFTALPLAVGFGISEPQHLAALYGRVEAAVVGSALVQEVEQARTAEGACRAIQQRVRAFKQACRGGEGHG